MFPKFEGFLGKLSSHDNFKKTSASWLKLGLITMWVDVHIILRIANSHLHPDYEHHFCITQFLSHNRNQHRESYVDVLFLSSSGRRRLLCTAVSNGPIVQLPDKMKENVLYHQCNVTESEKLKYLEKILHQYHLAH